MSLTQSRHAAKELFKDQDVQAVKMMVGRLVSNQELDVVRGREQQHLAHIEHLNRVINDLTHKLAGLDQQYRKVVGALNQERQGRKQDQLNYSIHVKKMMHEKASPIYFSPKTQIQRSNAVRIENYTPERNRTPTRYNNSGSGSGGYLRRLETPIGQLLDIRHTQPSKDQIHRLNSYLIENTTAVKLLTQKYNYLMKLRGLGQTSRDQELELIAKSKRVIGERAIAEEARRYLDSSRRRNNRGNSSQSDIENEHNNIVVSNL